MIKILLYLFFFLCSLTALAQNDTLILKNNDLMVGEIKSMDKGILTIETEYSDVDFKVSWSGIKRGENQQILPDYTFRRKEIQWEF